MQISLKLNTEHGEQVLDASELTEKQADKLVDAFINSLGMAAEHPEPIIFSHQQKTEDLVSTLKASAPKEDIEEEVILDNGVTSDDLKKYERKQFGTSFQEKMAEAFQKQADGTKKKTAKITHESPAECKASNVTKKYIEEQSHHETGIKYKLIRGTPDVPTYRCRWHCPNPTCNDSGNHYIPEGTKVTFCYTCNTKMKVEEATSMGFPNRDDNGNFYVASEEM